MEEKLGMASSSVMTAISKTLVHSKTKQNKTKQNKEILYYSA